jgi:hypothetical protein
VHFFVTICGAVDEAHFDRTEEEIGGCGRGYGGWTGIGFERWKSISPTTI